MKKTRSMQFKFLITVISAMLAITFFVGGISIYEVDQYVQKQTNDFINVVCENEASQVNDIFGDMEKSVKIMESYVMGFMRSKEDIENHDRQKQIIQYADEMFVDVAKNTNGAVAYYLRWAPEVSDSLTGLFYSKTEGGDDYVRYVVTDIAAYDKTDREHVGWYWEPYEAGKPIWLAPYHNLNNDIWMISYVIPLYFEGQFFGVVGMDFDYTVLTDRVHEIQIYENGFAHLKLDGKAIHSENCDAGHMLGGSHDDYMQVTEELANGMTLAIFASYDDIREIRYNIAFKIMLVVVVLVTVFFLLALFVVRRIVKPLRELTEAAVKLTSGNYDVDIAHSDTYEIKLLTTAFENMTMHLREHEKMQYLLAYRDSLTELRNTTAYKVWVNDFDKEIAETKADFAVIVFDINFLKETNDHFGHDTGNKLIVTAAHIIANVFKRSPVFRIGGDEFVAILQKKDLEECVELLREFDEKCANEYIEVRDEKIPVKIARGFAQYDSAKDEKFLDVFNRADDEMYKNKRSAKEQ